MMAPAPVRPVNVNPDGTFRFTGLSPGKLRLGTMNDSVRGLSTARVELNGANVTNGFELAEGAQVTGLRIVLTYGSGTIVGQTTFVNGTLPAGARVMANARPAMQPGQPPPTGAISRTAEVDGRGFFRIEGVPPGEYDVIVHVFVFNGTPVRPSNSEPQRVVIGDGGEAKVSPVVNLQPPAPRKEP
jgi:hypothetical protein